MSAFVFDDVAVTVATGCKGAYVRYRETGFISGRKVKVTQELYELKRISCPGCPVCGSIWDVITESGANSVEISPHLQNGDVAELHVVVDSIDPETGQADDWHVQATCCDIKY